MTANDTNVLWQITRMATNNTNITTRCYGANSLLFVTFDIIRVICIIIIRAIRV